MTRKYFLIINTASQGKIILALSQDSFILDKLEIKTKFGHSEKLLLGIDRLLRKNKIRLKEIKVIGVVRGPGSYTALKIGLTVANVLGFSLEIPVIGVKLSEFENLKELVGILLKKYKKEKSRKIVLPFYGEKPYYKR